jgi:hypothetical protein
MESSMKMQPNDKRMDEQEYLDRFIRSDYAKQKDPLDSVTIDNFLTDSELDVFWAESQSDKVYHVHDTGMANEMLTRYGREQPTTANYYVFSNFYTDPKWTTLVDIIQPKLEAAFGDNIFASHIHVLDSHVPYGIHSDSEQPNMVLAPNPAYTLIIPFDDIDSKTYQFHQRSAHKAPWDWIHAENIPSLPDYSISKEMWESEFAPLTDYNLFLYLTVESAFQWRRGSLFAADRFRFHCSDNYYNKGITSKRAIVAWTSTR